MNKQEFEKNIDWDEYGIGYVRYYVPIFDAEIKFELFSEDDKIPSISDKIFLTVEDVLNLPINSVEKIKDLLWEECDFSFTVADYGCEPNDGETTKEAHFREFDLNDKQDAFAKSNVQAIQIHYKSDELIARYAEIKIETATSNLVSIIVKNGKIVDYDDDGTHLGWFETDEMYAHNNRIKVLNE